MKLLLSVSICLAYINIILAAEHFIDGKLYFFEDSDPNYYTWHEAIDFCHNRGVGYELVSIETLEENTAIKNVMAANYTGYNFWLGALKEDNGEWFWRNGLAVSIWDWGTGEPSNNQGEDYLIMSANNDWQDSTSNNENSQRALCEAY